MLPLIGTSTATCSAGVIEVVLKSRPAWFTLWAPNATRITVFAVIFTVTWERSGTTFSTSGNSSLTNSLNELAPPRLGETEVTVPNNTARVTSVCSSTSTSSAVMFPLASTWASNSTNIPGARPLKPETFSNSVELVTFTSSVRPEGRWRVKLPTKFGSLLVVETDSTVPCRSSSSPSPFTSVITEGRTRNVGFTTPVTWPDPST